MCILFNSKLWRHRKKKTSWIWTDIWTNPSLLNSLEEEKVCNKLSTIYTCIDSLLTSQLSSFCNRDTVTGILKGYDTLVNLVLDDCDEYMRGMLPFSTNAHMLIRPRRSLQINRRYQTSWISSMQRKCSYAYSPCWWNWSYWKPIPSATVTSFLFVLLVIKSIPSSRWLTHCNNTTNSKYYSYQFYSIV